MSSWLRMSWKHPARRRVMSILRSAAPSRTAPESEVIEPPSNAATTGRPSTGGNAKSSELHSVCIGAPYGFEKSRVGNRFLSDSQPRCTCFGEKSALVGRFVVTIVKVCSTVRLANGNLQAVADDAASAQSVGAQAGLLE